MTPREIIRQEYGESRNFMTPHRLGIGALPGGAYELATGTGLDGRSPIWGVSVVWLNSDGTTCRDVDAGGCFDDPQGAQQHIRQLKRAARREREQHHATTT